MEGYNYLLPYPAGTIVIKKSSVDSNQINKVYNYSIYADGIYVCLLENIESKTVKISKPITLERFMQEYEQYEVENDIKSSLSRKL